MRAFFSPNTIHQITRYCVLYEKIEKAVGLQYQPLVHAKYVVNVFTKWKVSPKSKIQVSRNCSFFANRHICLFLLAFSLVDIFSLHENGPQSQSSGASRYICVHYLSHFYLFVRTATTDLVGFCSMRPSYFCWLSKKMIMIKCLKGGGWGTGAGVAMVPGLRWTRLVEGGSATEL